MQEPKPYPCPFCGGEMDSYGIILGDYLFEHPINDCFLIANSENGAFRIYGRDVKRWNRALRRGAQHEPT